MFHCDSKLPEDSNSAVIFQAIPTIGIDQMDPTKIMGFFSDWATSLWKASFRIIQYHPKNIKNSWHHIAVMTCHDYGSTSRMFFLHPSDN